ncbi:MAG: DUF429 domain-containing protein [Deltaproteobacteria bacterium]|nr:DUF429 domain-containing protein [Deltaproteobacteria bacterium]
MNVFLGFDPGGKGSFGWAVCIDKDDGLDIVATGLADHAKGALEQSLNAKPKGGSIAGAGIDAPMFWVNSECRESDNIVRKAIKHLGAKSPGGTVQHFNSLRGACVIQGLLILKLLRRLYPNLPITEAHPKALLWLMGIARKDYEPQMVTSRDLSKVNIRGTRFRSEDERDAVLGAFTAQMMVRKKPNWDDLLKYEKDPILAGNPPIGYWMPNLRQSMLLKNRKPKTENRKPFSKC